MDIVLPKTKRKATRQNPKKLVIFGKPKTGKTTILSQLDNCLILDLESGSEFVDARVLDIKKIAEEQNSTPLEVLKEVIKKIGKTKDEIGKFPYKYIAIDTITELESMVMPLAAQMYRNTALGSSWAGNDVTKLPNGAGYTYLREAFLLVLSQIESLCDTLILVGHLKDKMIDKEGKEMTERGIDLTGKTSRLVAANVDALGYIYREENKTILNFAPSESLEAGARPEHLKGKEIVIAESDDSGKITTFWTEVFVN